jgi:hypothetical protein
LKKRIDSRYDYIHIRLLTGFISRFFFIKKKIPSYIRSTLVLCWFVNRRYGIKEPPGTSGGFHETISILKEAI